MLLTYNMVFRLVMDGTHLVDAIADTTYTSHRDFEIQVSLIYSNIVQLKFDVLVNFREKNVLLRSFHVKCAFFKNGMSPVNIFHEK